MRDTPGRPGARDLSDDALQQVMQAEREAEPPQPGRSIAGDDLAEFDPEWVEELRAELRAIGDLLLHCHGRLDALSERIKERT